MIQVVSIIKFKEYYWIYAQSRVVNGPWIADDPFIKLPLNIDGATFIDSIEIALNNSKQDVPLPNDWSDFGKDYLQKMGLKSKKELLGGTRSCDIEKSDHAVEIIPTRNLGVKGGGFVFLTPLKITLPNIISDNEFFIKIQEAFAKSE